jgi:hypothetical protein
MAGANLPQRGAAVLLPALLLAVPLFDVLLVSVTRPLNGRSISDGARDHSSHRLVLLGLSEAGAVRLLHLIGFMAGLLAICQAKSASGWVVGGVVLFVVALALLWSCLARLDLPESWLSRHPGRQLRIPAVLTRLASAMFPVSLGATLIALAIYFAFLLFSAGAVGIRTAMLLAAALAAGLILVTRKAFGLIDDLVGRSAGLTIVRVPQFRGPVEEQNVERFPRSVVTERIGR